jgi:hypothetical protein
MDFRTFLRLENAVCHLGIRHRGGRLKIDRDVFRWPLIVQLRARLDGGLEHLPNIDLALEREAAGQGEKFVKRFMLGAAGGQLAGYREVGVGKPDPAAFRRMFAALAVEPAEVCVVGDSLVWDIRPAMALGCFTILYDPEAGEAVGRGSGDAHVVVRTLASLATHLPGAARPPWSE